jgi:hypothetical protein
MSAIGYCHLSKGWNKGWDRCLPAYFPDTMMLSHGNVDCYCPFKESRQMVTSNVQTPWHYATRSMSIPQVIEKLETSKEVEMLLANPFRGLQITA